MNYPFPARWALYDQHKDYPAPSTWPAIVTVLREARDLIEQGVEQFICIACMRAARELGALTVGEVLKLTGVIEDRLGMQHTSFESWLMVQLGYRQYDSLDRQAVLRARLAWIDNLIWEFSR